MATNRREFMARSIGASTLLASGWTLPGFLTRSASATDGTDPDRILVVVQLTGGNDGLNTVVPYADDAYHRARPSLRISEDRVLRLDGSLGLHPDMEAFKALYDDGALGVITNVGYPNPDRSHFRSMDIWHTATGTPEGAETGWLGRVVDLDAGRGAPPALHLDNGSLPLALRASENTVPSVRDIGAFRLDGDSDQIERAIRSSRDAATDDLLFVQRTAIDSCSTARRLETVADERQSLRAYPNYGLAQRLRQVASLIDADFGARIYYTSMGGFDTHARQELSHGPLLRELAESVGAFHADLKARGLDDRVLTMTFSEFGRRVDENGSRGTDHGAAAPMFMVGAGAKAGITGSAPDLVNVPEGDVKFDLDFRDVYAGVLRNWLDVDHARVLGPRFSPAPVIRAESR